MPSNVISCVQYVTWRNDETLGGIEGCMAAVQAADPDFGMWNGDDSVLGISVLIRCTYTDINLYLLNRADIRVYHVLPVCNYQDYADASFTSSLLLCCSDGACDQHRTAVGGYGKFSAARPKAGRCHEEDAGSGQLPGAYSPRETARQSHWTLRKRVIVAVHMKLNFAHLEKSYTSFQLLQKINN